MQDAQIKQLNLKVTKLENTIKGIKKERNQLVNKAK